MQQQPQTLQQQRQFQQQQQQQQQQSGLQQQQNGSIATGQPPSSSALNSPTNAYAGNVGPATSMPAKKPQINGGRFDFDDGGTYCGGWEEGKAHGYGVCTGPKHQGAYAGTWNYGFEVSGVYIWPSGSTFEGQWQNGRRHGVGVEHRGRLIYRGEWTAGNKGRYGVRQSTTSNARYEGTWANGLQDGYGSETYADGGYYQGQWQDGKRNGYGVRTSAPFGLASHYRSKHVHSSMSSLRSNENDQGEKHRGEDVRGGFVLKARSDEPPARRNSLGEKSKKGFLSKIRKQRSTGDLEKRGTGASGSIRSTVSTASWISTGSSQSGMTAKSVHTDSNASFTVEEEQLDPTVVETYMGEWKHDKRTGYGISERSDGLKYEGEWVNNKKHGYGITTFRDGTQEEGKYKNNVLITSQKKKHLFLIRSRKFRERIEAAVSSSQRASKYALQKADIAVSRTSAAREKAQFADTAGDHARIDCEMAVSTAREFAPDFKPSVLERFERLRFRERYRIPSDIEPPKLKSAGTSTTNSPSSNQGPGGALNKPETNQTIDAFSSPNQTSNQSAMSRRPSIHPMMKQPAVDYSQNPNQSMYPPVSPQSDLTHLVNQQESMHPSTTTTTTNNPSYQFQQQQPPGGGGGGIIGGGGGMSGPMGNYIGSQPGQSSEMYGSNLSSSNNPGMQQYLPQQQSYQAGQQQQIYQFQQQQTGNPPGIYQQPPMMLQQQQPQQPQPPQQPNYYGGYENSIDAQHQSLYPLQNQAIGTNPAVPMRRQSRPLNDSSRPPMLGSYNQTSIDYFDHYKRAPSRDTSVDRYTRAASRMSGGGGSSGGGGGGHPLSRQTSVDRTAPPQQPQQMSGPPLSPATIQGGGGGNPTSNMFQDTPDRRIRAGSVARGQTPGPINHPTTTGNGTVLTGIGTTGSRAGTPMNSSSMAAMQAKYSSPNQPFEDVLLRQRTLGQDIIPSPLQPKRTESLFMPPKPLAATKGAAGGGAGGGKKLKSVPITVALQRKKSLPDVQDLPRSSDAMSREEVSALGSARREEIRRQIENSEKLKANPLLYLVSPQVKDWFSRQQLVLLVLAMNVVLAIMFFKMLT